MAVEFVDAFFVASMFTFLFFGDKMNTLLTTLAGAVASAVATIVAMFAVNNGKG